MDVLLELWKDAKGVRLVFNAGEDLDFSYEAIEHLIVAVDEFVTDEPNGAYKALTFDVEDEPYEKN